MSDWYDELLTAITEDDRNGVLTVINRLPNIPDSAHKLNEDAGSLVFAACQKGYLELLESLSFLGVVFTETCTEKSPIQVACEYGQESVVEWYIERGVPILPGRTKPWEEESPLYIASRNGYHGIIDKLICAEPSLIKDDKVRQCLLYAACLSGDVLTVKKWLSPSIDINHPIQLVKNLTDCEKLTPLYAACSGGHVNIINMLCENFSNVIFTSSLCNDHPDVIGEVLEKYIVPSATETSQDDLFKKCIGYLQNKNLQVIHDSWLIPHCVTLVELDVSNNSLYELPSCLPWKLQNLKILNASRNNIKKIEFLDDEISTSLSLEDVNLSYNKLDKICIELFEIRSLNSLNLSNNVLVHLSRSLLHQVDPEEDSSALLKRRSVIQERHWCCSNLRRLDISHNSLVMLPVEIHVCIELIHINASYNRLTTFPQPWGCPLEILDLSHNQLERFPVGTELFWSNSLKLLNISNNQLHEINEGIVKLSMLSDLIACNNKIERLPGPDVWENRNLHNINLKHNKLGVIVESPNKRRLLFTRHRSTGEDSPQLQFPVCLANCLKELRLADNNLDCVPISICDLRSLEILDLSSNPLIDKLPRQMGYLKNLGVLKLKGVTPSNISSALLQDNGSKTREIIGELLETLHDCKPYNKIKTVVLGKKDKGKTTLVNILGGKKSQKVETKSIVRREISLAKKTLAVWKDTEIKLNVWDISGDEVYTQIHHSVFTPSTLYILVWDFWSITDELDKIATWINNIQAKSTSFKIVLVGTFIDRFGKFKPDKVNIVNDTLVKKFGDELAPTLCPVSCTNNDGIDDLRVVLYETALSMKMSTRGRPPVIGRKIPSCYTLMEKRIMEVQKRLEEECKPLYLTQSEYIEVIESIANKDNDLQSTEETNAVTRFLEEIGAILHFSDQLGALDTLYFLDPAWLCDILVHILICPEGKKLLKQERGQIKRSSAELLYEKSEHFPSEFVKQYIELLERFEIATFITQTDRLFFPCQLPIDPPIIQTTDNSTDVVIVKRLYKMSECPSGFWMRLITRMMIRVEQFEKKNWMLRPAVGSCRRLMTIRRGTQRPGSFNKHGRFCGLTIKKPKQTYSREMIHVSHEDGSFCVEPVNFTEGDLHKGVLITEESKTANFAMMGVIVDEIEDIIQDFYPGLLELDSVTMGYHLERYALCSRCYQDVPLSNRIDHFTMEHCARMLVNEECITCPKGIKQELKVLVPDLLMKEIPGKFFMDISKLQFTETKENCLGAGVTGSVFKASYDGVPVAIKIYRSDIRNATKMQTSDSTNSDSGTATLSTQGSMDGKIYENLSDAKKLKCLDEAESIKSLRAIREMRQEIGITSRLQHPCIISLVGLAFRPKLMMALELAPLGSLRDVLDKELQNRPEFNRYKNRNELFQPLFDKELTYKFVYQIAKGLEYLHSNGIIYKDLKSDNILAVSTNLQDPVNLKLSDYGISKFSWGGRSVGLVGTPGYQAPEILDGRPYDEKVDIFSFSMVIFEILSGKRPYFDCENLAQIIKAMKTEGRRPSIKDLRILTKFPSLESMMEICWETTASLRPSAKTLSSKCYMQNVQLLAQTWKVKDPDNEPFTDRCVLGPSESGSKPVLCIWDVLDDVSSFTIMDPDWLTVPVKRTKYECPPVVCMTTAGKHIWVGHESSATVYSPKSGSFAEIGSYQLEDTPVQILSFLNNPKTYNANEQMNTYKVFIALKHGTILQFKTQKFVSDGTCVMRKTVKRISGYSNPSSISLRTSQIHCMAVAVSKNELWIASRGYIDIVSCQDFKVNKDRRINVAILLRMCKLPSQLHVYQIVNYKSQMFCLLDNSPYVLEFCADTYVCKTVFTLDGMDVYSRVVAKNFNFTEDDHEAYLGVTSAGSGESDSDLSSSGEDPPDLPPRSQKTPPVPRRQGSVAEKAQKVLGIDSSVSVCNISEIGTGQGPAIPPKPVRPKTFVSSTRESIAPPRPPRGRAIHPISHRLESSIARNTSFSLPNMPTHNNYTIIVTSLAIVKDTLWVGRSCGSISVVSICKDAKYTYGKVVADLHNVKRHRGALNNRSCESEIKTIEAVKIYNTGKYVAARYLQSGESSRDVAIAFWEGYGSHDIERIDKYSSDIINIEKNLARFSSMQTGDNLSSTEEF